MEAYKYILLYLGSFASFLAIDMVWLGVIAKDLYRNNLKHLIATDFNKIAVFSFYGLFIVGVLVFATLPALREGSLAKAVGLGALFGLITYATYDLTNQATLKNWPLNITLIDLAWGTFITAAVSTAGYFIGKQLGF